MSYDITRISQSDFLDKMVKIERSPEAATSPVVTGIPKVNDPYNFLIAHGVYKGSVTINNGKKIVTHIYLDGHPEPIIHFPGLTQTTIDFI